MRQELTQTQAQLGGETQQAYYPDDRELWWSSRLGDVSLYVYDYDTEERWVQSLNILTPKATICERCDCVERWGDVRHNDGGWYHSIIRLYQITPHIYVASHEDSRDAFSASELRNVVIFVKGEPVGKLTLKEGEWAELLRKDEAESLLRSYQEDDNFKVYYSEK
jgi:hypothetical protein